nr:MAG TPA: hypothetical protein [Bacteriophage sp.]
MQICKTGVRLPSSPGVHRQASTWRTLGNSNCLKKKIIHNI